MRAGRRRLLLQPRRHPPVRDGPGRLRHVPRRGRRGGRRRELPCSWTRCRKYRTGSGSSGRSSTGAGVCVTGSNASLLGRDLARAHGPPPVVRGLPVQLHRVPRLTRRHRGASSFRAYLDDGGFPAFLKRRQDLVLQELLRDIVQRDVAARYGLRETRHVMNLALFLFANTGQPLSLQTLTKSLAVPTVAQTSRYVEHLMDAYLLFAVPRYSASSSSASSPRPSTTPSTTGCGGPTPPRSSPTSAIASRTPWRSTFGGDARPLLRRASGRVGVRLRHARRRHPGLPRIHAGEPRAS